MTSPTYCPHCSLQIGRVRCDTCGELTIQCGDLYCRDCGAAHPAIDPESLEYIEDAQTRGTKSIGPRMSLAAREWIEVEAKRSSMTDNAYLAAMLIDYEGGPAGFLALVEGEANVPMNLEVPVSVHSWLKESAVGRPETMAHVVRWVIDQEMGGGM